MMDIFWKAALQGIIQGITEFLPISSTGHLILFGKLLDMGDGSFVKMFNVVIQLASILAVVLYFHQKLLPVQIFRDLPLRKKTFMIWLKVLIGVLPILLIGFICKDLVEKMQEQPLIVAGALFIGGLLLLKIEDWCHHESPVQDFAELSCRTAFCIGLIQCIALIPGVSRSAATIIGALALGTSRPLAAEFSFFLAIPTMAAASGYSLLKHGGALTGTEWIAITIGFAVSFVVSWGVIAWLMNFIKRRSFQIFGWYRILLALVVAVIYGILYYR